MLINAFELDVLKNYTVPLEYARGSSTAFGDGTHLFFLNNGTITNLKDFHFENRIIIQDSLRERYFRNSRVHFRIDSIYIYKNKAYLKLSAILTNGVFIRSSDLSKAKEIQENWAKEYLNNLSISIYFRKKKSCWKVRSFKCKYIPLYYELWNLSVRGSSG